MTRIDFLWQELISCDKNWFLVTRIDFLWQEFISCGKKWFLWQWYIFCDKNWVLVTRINFSWTFKINKTLLNHKIRFYKARAGPWITLSQAKYWSKKWSSHEAKYFSPPCLGPKRFWDKKCLGPKKFGTKKVWNLKIFLDSI